MTETGLEDELGRLYRAGPDVGVPDMTKLPLGTDAATEVDPTVPRVVEAKDPTLVELEWTELVERDTVSELEKLIKDSGVATALELSTIDDETSTDTLVKDTGVGVGVVKPCDGDAGVEPDVVGPEGVYEDSDVADVVDGKFEVTGVVALTSDEAEPEYGVDVGVDWLGETWLDTEACKDEEAVGDDETDSKLDDGVAGGIEYQVGTDGYSTVVVDNGAVDDDSGTIPGVGCGKGDADML